MPFNIFPERRSALMTPNDAERREWLEEILSDWKAQTKDPKLGERFAARVRMLFDQVATEAERQQQSNQRYARFARPADAIKELLEQEGKPMDPNEVKRRLLEQGFVGDTDDPDANISRSLSSYTPEARGNRTLLKYGPDPSYHLVGLGEWPDSMFE